MLRLTGTRAYELPVWDENPGTKAKPNVARPQMHFESMTVQMVFDSSGLYRTWLGVYFSWWDFCYTALLGNWSEGSRFVLTLARSNERRYLEIRDGHGGGGAHRRAVVRQQRWAGMGVRPCRRAIMVGSEIGTIVLITIY